MCGISGFLHFDRERRADRSVLQRMGDCLRHRGPDGEGFFVDGPLGFAHRRLAIIDLETGDQPMVSEDRKLAIIFNGEIYNYLELREELKGLGHLFRTSSDTEVLLRAYEQWGLSLHEKLNGMWAFALWDGRTKRLLLSRDRLGEKPLHFAEWDNSLIFGSEIKSVIAGGVTAEANEEVLDLYFTLGYVPAPYTFYRRIKKLRPAHYLLVQDGLIEEHSYWNVPLVDEEAMRADGPVVEEEFQNLFSDAVRLRMRSDVAYGAFLSGGLDSSCVVAAMSAESREAVKTFTIGFPEHGFDERPLARQVARRFGAEHHEGTVSPEAFGEALDETLRCFDEPFGDSSAIPTSQVARHARQVVKMALTGDGGDEVLSGYNAYQSEKLAAWLGKAPKPIIGSLESTMKAASRLGPGEGRYRAMRLARVLKTSRMRFEDRLLMKASQLDPVRRRAVLAPLSGRLVPAEEFLEGVMKPCPYQDGFYRMMYFNLKVSLPEDMLTKVDRMTMAHSLEARVPFLDHRLVELMAVVHKNIKMRNFQRKSVLRRTLGHQLPPAVLRAPKRGFRIPLHRWFQDAAFFANDQRKLLCKRPFGLDPSPLKEVVEENAAGKADHGNLLWMCFLLDRWASGAAAS